jgi:hypothetical protein
MIKNIGGHNLEFTVHSPKYGDIIILIDDEDWEKIKNYKWYTNSKKYIFGRIDKNHKLKFLHRVIMNASKKQYIDHINGNKNDNRKLNLRLCNNSQNLRNRGKQKNNTSGYKGVYWHKNKTYKYKKWVAIIQINYKQIFLGNFETKEQAALVYNQAAIKYHGEFARLNQI